MIDHKHHDAFAPFEVVEASNLAHENRERIVKRLAGDCFEIFVVDIRDVVEMAVKTEDSEFSDWISSPDYEICRSKALELMGGDEKAAHAVIVGAALLHELPPELRKRGQESGRAEWAHQKMDASLQKDRGRFPGLHEGIEKLFADKGVSS